MRRIILLSLTCAIMMSFVQDKTIYSYTAIIMSRADLEKSIKATEPRDLQNTGKIYYKDSTIYIVEKYKGVHVIDNTNPSSPSNIGFITIPGCIDIAIKNHSLFADNAVDLVSVNIASYPQVEVTGRVKNAFPELMPPDLTYIPEEYTLTKRPANTVIVGWEILK